MNKYRISVILLFAIAFTLFGTFAPVLYASNVPQNQIIEVDKFTAQNTTTTASQHHICLDRTVHTKSIATTVTELYMIDENGTRIQVSSNTEIDYLHSGNNNIIQTLSLPDNLIEGEYKYIFVANVELADSRVKRTFTFESEPFKISDDINVTTREEVIENC
jgi:hypothetical protein